jgi:hypothetical protein
MFGKIVIVNNELMKIKGHLNPKHLKKKKKKRYLDKSRKVSTNLKNFNSLFFFLDFGLSWLTSLQFI